MLITLIVFTLVAEEGFEPPTHRLRIGWPNDPGCSERDIQYFAGFKRRSPCSERPDRRPSLSNRAFKLGADPAVLRLGSVVGAPSLQMLALALSRCKSPTFLPADVA